MKAVDKVREKWAQWKLSRATRRLGDRWNKGLAVEVLDNDALQDRRFDNAKRSAERRLDPFSARSPKYPPVNGRTLAMEGFRKNATVRRCQDLLCESATSAKLIVEDLDGKLATTAVSKRIREFIAFPSGRERSGARGSVGAFVWLDLYWRLLLDLYNYGNGLLEWVPGAGTQDPVRMWRLPPNLVWIQPHELWSEKIEGYVLELDGVPFRIPRERVIHTRFWDPIDEYWGVPPLWSAFRDLAADNEQTDFQKVTIDNHGVPPAAVEYSQEFIEHSQLDPHMNPSDAKSLQSLRDLFAENYGGRHRGKMAIEWGFKIHLIGMDMRKLDISALVRISETHIARVHGVPMTLIDRSSPEPDRPGASTRQMKEVFFTGTVAALVRRVESVFSPRIVAAFDPLMRHRIRFDLGEVDVIREMRLRRWREGAQVFQSGIADRGTCQRAAGIPEHGDLGEFAPLQQAKIPGTLPGDQSEEAGP